MKTKLIGILICMLLIATALPAVGTTTIQKTKSNEFQQTSTSKDVVWSDDFDSYSAGTLLHGQGGWEAWDLVVELSPKISINQSNSIPNSVELKYYLTTWSDIVHMFYGVNSGQWTITAKWFLPEGFYGHSNFILHNKYEQGNHQFPQDGSLALIASSSLGVVYDYWGGSETLPLIKDEWVDIRIEIDFDSDTVEMYYNNTLLATKSWTFTGGSKNLACINLANDGAISNVSYFDDITLAGEVSIDPDLYCEGNLKWYNVEPGDTIENSFILQNSGAVGTLLDWEIESYPEWGEWSFDPVSGTDLTAWSPITVNVEIVAPDEKDKFTGEIKIVNSEDPNDYEILSIVVSTPKNSPVIFNLFEWLFKQFPKAFPILRSIFEI